MVRVTERLLGRADEGLGEAQAVGRRSGDATVPVCGTHGTLRAGPSGRNAAEVVTKYVLTDMYAKAVQGMTPDAAVKWAQGELVRIYGA
jgi:hypothetical protein